MFYNFDKMISYNSLLNFVIGERGVGKTYGSKVYVINHFLKRHKQFVYIRRYKTELKSALFNGTQPIFFNQVKQEFKDVKLNNTKDLFYINGEVGGYAIPLSTSNILKSSTFDNVDTIIFDEFIIDKGSYHYLQNEVTQLLDIIETITRLRDIRVIFLGNAISITNPYFMYFNLTLPYNSEFKIEKRDNKGRPLILVNYIKNEVYREVKKQSRFGQLIKDTEYGDYAIDNKFLRDNKAFIEKKDKDSKFYYTIILNKQYYGVWLSTKTGKIYISYDYDKLFPVPFTINNSDHNSNTYLIKIRNSNIMKTLTEHYRNGLLCFENQKIKNVFMQYLAKLLN